MKKKRKKYERHLTLHDPVAECLKVPEVSRLTRFGGRYVYTHLLRPGSKRQHRDAWIPTLQTGTRTILIPRKALMEALALRTTTTMAPTAPPKKVVAR